METDSKELTSCIAQETARPHFLHDVAHRQRYARANHHSAAPNVLALAGHSVQCQDQPVELWQLEVSKPSQGSYADGLLHERKSRALRGSTSGAPNSA